MERELSDLPVLDQHAHNICRSRHAPPFEAAFSESTDQAVWQRDTPHTLFLLRSVTQLADLFACEPDLEAVKEARARLDLPTLSRKCFEEANLCGLLLDDGLLPDKVHPWQWHQQFVPTRRILRIEAEAEKLLADNPGFEAFEEAFRQTLTDSLEHIVAFKSIAAYRGGLEISRPTRQEASADFERGSTGRLESGPLYHYLLHIALDVAARNGVPIQFHTGFGDPDLALERSNPLLLRPLVETYRCPFVLLHAGYPYFRELGFMASVYLNVWTDFGLAVPFLSTTGMEATVSGLLELAPLNKVMYSSDASLIPELFYLGARNGRRALAKALQSAVEQGDLTAHRALEAARGILSENARELYSLTSDR